VIAFEIGVMVFGGKFVNVAVELEVTNKLPSLDALGLLEELDSPLAGGSGVLVGGESNWNESNSDRRLLILLFRGLVGATEGLLLALSLVTRSACIPN
jgi:hypothetical protein